MSRKFQQLELDFIASKRYTAIMNAKPLLYRSYYIVSSGVIIASLSVPNVDDNCYWFDKRVWHPVTGFADTVQHEDFTLVAQDTAKGIAIREAHDKKRR